MFPDLRPPDFSLKLTPLAGGSTISPTPEVCLCTVKAVACPKASFIWITLGGAFGFPFPARELVRLFSAFYPTLYIWPFLRPFHFLHGYLKPFLFLRHILHPSPCSKSYSDLQLDRLTSRQPLVYHLVQYSHFKNHRSYMPHI